MSFRLPILIRITKSMAIQKLSSLMYNFDRKHKMVGLCDPRLKDSQNDSTCLVKNSLTVCRNNNPAC